VSAPQGSSYPNGKADTPEDDAEGDADEDACGRGVEEVVGQEAEEHAADDSADQEPAQADEVAATQAALGRVIGHPVWSVRAVGVWSSGSEPPTCPALMAASIPADRSERASAGDDAGTLPQQIGHLRTG
jgi:hypothetical protein